MKLRNGPLSTWNKIEHILLQVKVLENHTKTAYEIVQNLADYRDQMVYAYKHSYGQVFQDDIFCATFKKKSKLDF